MLATLRHTGQQRPGGVGGARARVPQPCSRLAPARAFANGSSGEPPSFLCAPDGTWIMGWADAGTSDVYGEQFVMPRSSSCATAAPRRSRALGLVRRPPTGVTVRRPQHTDIITVSAEEVEIIVLPVQPETGMVPWRAMLADPGQQEEQPGSASTAIVPHASSMLRTVLGSVLRRRDGEAGLSMSGDADEDVYETFNDPQQHPRRTAKIKFVCKRCGATTIKPVNPHAWAAGSVFAQCGRCKVTHKLIDNLNLFHELSGPVFPPPPLGSGGPAAAGAAVGGEQQAQQAGGQPAQPGGTDINGLQYGPDGLPLLPARLRLRLPPWAVSRDNLN